jgi:hypothetical protein
VEKACSSTRRPHSAESWDEDKPWARAKEVAWEKSQNTASTEAGLGDEGKICVEMKAE